MTKAEFYLLEPEVAGGLGPSTRLDTSVHPPKVSWLEYRFDGWLGDDLVESFPCFVVTQRLADALVAAKLTGFDLQQVEVSKSDAFEEKYPDWKLPDFLWLRVTGRGGVDDVGTAVDHRMIVSKRALDVLRSKNLNYCQVEPAQ